MTDTTDHPVPTYDPRNVAVTLHPDDDPDDFAIDVDDEVIATRTTFSWTVKFTVSGTWVADGFDLDHKTALDMLATEVGNDLGNDFEIDAQVLSAPPPPTIRAIQGGCCDEAQVGQQLLDMLRTQAVARARGQASTGEETVAATSSPILADALGILGDAAVGIEVQHRGYQMCLSRDDGRWSAHLDLEEAGSSEPHLIWPTPLADTGDARADIMAALDACANAANAYEGDEDED